MITGIGEVPGGFFNVWIYSIGLDKELLAMMIKHINCRPCLKRLDVPKVVHNKKSIP